MAKFKVGDKVEVISLYSKSSGYGVNIGMVGEVAVECNSDYGCVGVKFNHNINGNSLYHAGEHALGKGAKNGLWIDPECLKLIEEKEKPTEPQFKNMKIRIKDEEHSRLVQETLFEMGYKWLRSAGVQYTHMPWLSTYEGGCIYYGQSQGSEFDEHQNEEVELVTTYSFKPVDQEAKRKAAEKEALQKNVAEMQRQLNEMKVKLEYLS